MAEQEGGEPNVEQKARELGWSPKEEFRGDPEKWIEAGEFVRRGEELMPILKANNRKLHDKVNALESEVTSTKNLLKNATESIAALKEFTTKETIKAARADTKVLVKEIKAAREDGDVEAETELTEKLGEARKAIKDAEAAPPPPKDAPPAEDPVKEKIFKEWAAENPWFGEDEVKAEVAIAIGRRLQAADRSLTGRALLDKVTVEIEKRFPSPKGVSKVEGGTHSNGGGGSEGKKSYADLPADAKHACDDFAKRLVGPGRAYKDLSEWRKAYVQTYDWS